MSMYALIVSFAQFVSELGVCLVCVRCVCACAIPVNSGLLRIVRFRHCVRECACYFDFLPDFLLGLCGPCILGSRYFQVVIPPWNVTWLAMPSGASSIFFSLFSLRFL